MMTNYDKLIGPNHFIFHKFHPPPLHLVTLAGMFVFEMSVLINRVWHACPCYNVTSRAVLIIYFCFDVTSNYKFNCVYSDIVYFDYL